MIVNPLVGKGLAAARAPKARVNVYEGSVRSSKTIGSLIEWIRFIRQGPAGNLLMTGRTQRTIINNLVLPMQEMLGTQRCKINYGLGTVDILGRTILLIGADNEAAKLVETLRPGYQPWFTPIWEPPTGEIASLLFALQAAIGAGLIGFYFGRRSASGPRPAPGRRPEKLAPGE